MNRQIVKGLRKVLLTRRKSNEYEKISVITNEDQSKKSKSKDTKSDKAKENTDNNEVVGTPGMNWTGEDKARLEYVMLQNNLREYNLLW